MTGLAFAFALEEYRQEKTGHCCFRPGISVRDHVVPGGIMALSPSYWAADRLQPVLGLTVGDALRDAAAARPRTTALVEGAVDPAARRRWSYAELLEESERAACALLGRFAPGKMGRWGFPLAW